MRKALIFAFASTLAWATFAQPAAAPKPTRGDGLVETLKAAEPALKTAFQNASQKAESGDAAAAEKVSRWLVYGQGTAVDLKSAFTWANKAAEAGRGTAQLHLGLLYRHGNGVEPDENASNAWFAKAAKSLPAQVEAKDTDAMLALATPACAIPALAISRRSVTRFSTILGRFWYQFFTGFSRLRRASHSTRSAEGRTSVFTGRHSTSKGSQTSLKPRKSMKINEKSP